MKMKFLALVLSLTFASTALAVTFVGNAGEGILTDDGRVYEAEMFALGRLTDPAVPRVLVLNKAIEQVVMDKLIFEDSLQKALGELILQLSAIEKLNPGLGMALAQAIGDLNFWFNPQMSTELIEPEAGGMPFAPDGKVPAFVSTTGPDGKEVRGIRIQLAIRRAETVEVNERDFAKMSESHRAALVLHEAVYSLVRCPQNPRFYCREQYRMAFDITKGLLRANENYDLPDAQKELMGYSSEAKLNARLYLPVLKLEFKENDLDEEPVVMTLVPDSQGPLAPDLSYTGVDKICEELKNKNSRKFRVVNVEATRGMLWVSPQILYISEKTGYLTPALSLRTPRISLQHFFDSNAGCELQLDRPGILLPLTMLVSS